MRRLRPIGLMAIGHACVDVYQGAVPSLVPFLVAERGLGYVAVSGITLAATLLSSVVQPVFGVLTDRRPLAWLIPVAMTTAGLGIALLGVGHSYWAAWLAAALSGLGVAAYHPEAARMARAVSGGSHVGMSWFSVGGNVGFALAPVLVTPLIAAGGLALTPVLVVPALVGALITSLAIRGAVAGVGRPQRAGSDDWPSFLRLSAIMVCRSIVFVGLGTFIALYAGERVGGGTTTGGVALFILFAAGAFGTLLGGRFATRYGRVRTMRTSYAVAVPAIAGLVFVPGPAFFGFLALTAIAMSIPFSLHVTLGQDFLPGRVGTAGGMTLGLAVSIGGIATPVLGTIAEEWSLRVALTTLIALALTSSLIGYALKEPVVE
ncbi:FSR family fosmidomycin resistance protein-like MFS transporter [Kribbella antiqua]|uniref:FSR family fosmidomycin resistance protein-like MFS transporter n=1 Tax=Kribbella antiqua TaxID=2512217 RepID=A0A4R2IMQ0_9ACTN|nr:MFS transporter [Kribbella antiqua]TCO46087.1 FSR family fosmidomycin resistance protein-like MFS transporter [Kribbella antiqua]